MTVTLFERIHQQKVRGQQVHNSNTVDCSLMVFMSGNPLGGILSCRNQNHCSTQQATNLTQATLQWAHRYSKNAVEKYYIDPQMFSFLTVAPENLQILPILPAQTCPDLPRPGLPDRVFSSLASCRNFTSQGATLGGDLENMSSKRQTLAP